MVLPEYLLRSLRLESVRHHPCGRSLRRRQLLQYGSGETVVSIVQQRRHLLTFLTLSRRAIHALALPTMERTPTIRFALLREEEEDSHAQATRSIHRVRLLISCVTEVLAPTLLLWADRSVSELTATMTAFAK